jgi:hypothetical protein
MPALLLLLLWFAAPAWGTTYYVDPAGSDTTGTGSSGNPWATPQKAVTSGTPVTAGDTILVRDGTYTDTDNSGRTILISSTSPSGTIGSPITLKSETCYGAEIQTPTNGGSMVAILVNRPYWIIECFEVTGDGLSGSQPVGTSLSGIFLDTGATGAIVRKNKIHDIGRLVCTDSSNAFTGVFTRGASNQLITENEIYTIGRLFNGQSGCVTTQNSKDHVFYVESASNTTITRNVAYDFARGYCLNLFKSSQPSTYVHTNLVFDHNVCDTTAGETRGPAGHIIYGQTINGFSIRNNIFSGPESCVLQTFSTGTYSSVSIVGNRTDINDTNFHCASSLPTGVTVGGTNSANASIGFTDRAGHVYTLAAGSASIDAGVDIGGTFDGSAPEAGRYEVPVFSSCEVTAATTIRVLFTNNTSPPLLPASGAITFTARKEGSDNPLNGAVARVGDNILELTVTNAYGGGNTADISWASGNITTTSGQPFRQTLTNQSCANNVAGAAYALTQAAYRFHGVYGLESSPEIQSVENAALFAVIKGGATRQRFAVTCAGADCPPKGFFLYYSTGGAYAAVPDAFDAGNVAFCGSTYSGTLVPANGAATTNQLSTSGTFTPGGVVFTSNAIPTVTGLNNGYKTELEYCIKFDTDATGTYTFRVRRQDGTVLDTYTVTPSIVLVDQQASGF